MPLAEGGPRQSEIAPSPVEMLWILCVPLFRVSGRPGRIEAFLSFPNFISCVRSLVSWARTIPPDSPRMRSCYLSFVLGGAKIAVCRLFRASQAADLPTCKVTKKFESNKSPETVFYRGATSCGGEPLHDFLERFLEVVDLFVGCGADNAGRVAGSDRNGNVMRDHAAGADDAAASLS